jgi:hypothetical protein
VSSWPERASSAAEKPATVSVAEPAGLAGPVESELAATAGSDSGSEGTASVELAQVLDLASSQGEDAGRAGESIGR